MKTSHLLPFLLFVCFLLFAGPACPPESPSPSDEGSVDTDSVYNGTIADGRGIRTDGETAGIFPPPERCDPYQSLSLLHLMEDEAALWDYISNGSYITQYCAGYPSPEMTEEVRTETRVIDGKTVTVTSVVKVGMDDCGFPFTRYTLLAFEFVYNQFYDMGKNPAYYKPFFLETDPFIILARLPNEEQVFFETAYAYHAWKLSQDSFSVGDRPDTVRMKEARQVFSEIPFPDAEALQRAHQIGRINYKISVTTNTSAIKNYVADRQVLLDQLFLDYPLLKETMGSGQTQQRWREETEISRRLEALINFSELEFFDWSGDFGLYTARLPQLILDLRENAALAREDILKAVDTKVFAVIDEMRKSDDPDIRATIERIDSIRAETSVAEWWPTQLEFKTALANEAAFPVEEPDLKALISAYKDKLPGKVPAIRAHIAELEDLMGEMDTAEVRSRPVIGLINRMILSAETYLNSLEQKYRETEGAVAGRAGGSEILYTLLYVQGIQDTLPDHSGKLVFETSARSEYPKVGGMQLPGGYFTLGETDRMDAYLRVIALEATYLDLRDLYREKLDGVIGKN